MNKISCIFISSFTLLALLLAALPGKEVLAKKETTPKTTVEALSPELQDAFLAATSKSFSNQGVDYTTQSAGLDYTLNTSGLQAQADGIQWRIALNGIGRGGTIKDVAHPQMVQTDTRLEYQRNSITEWYRETALGVEQGFTISKAPLGNGRLLLRLNLSTDLAVSQDADSRGLSFNSPSGQTLHYDELKAYDANGVPLAAEMYYTPAQILLQVDERGATYPITVDPLIYLEQKIIAPDGIANDNFGISVALKGDIALVGAYLDDVGANQNQGSVYVFTRSGSFWSFQQQLIASDGIANAYFGVSVAFDGDTALVGAYYDNIGANQSQGSVYIFNRSGSSWTFQQKLTASDGAAYDNFGISAALDGETAIVGAYNDDIGANGGQGSVYVFTHGGSSWSFQQKLTAPNGAASDLFGYSVALDGDTALVSAYGDDIGANGDQGSAYVFTRSGTTWSFQQQLTAPDGAASDLFGFSVALDGDTAIVGAHCDDVGANSNQGSAYVFTRSGTTWNFRQKLTASDGAAYDDFGRSVTLDGDTALVSAYGDDIDVNGDQGSTYVFTRSGITWSFQQKLTASDGAASDLLGISVALDSDTALIGAYGDDIGANQSQGSVYIYQPHTDLSLSAAFNTSSAHPGDTVFLTLSVANFGPTYSAFNLAVNAPLPTGLTYVTSAPTHGTYQPATGNWNVGPFPAGASATLILTATVNSPPKTLNFNASIIDDDINIANNSASASLKVLPLKVIFRSQGFNDGWVLESGEISNSGGSLNALATTLRLGDDAYRKQYRSILSFNTKVLPDNAVITKVLLQVRRQGISGGGDPLTIFQGFMVDMRRGFFGSSPGLQSADFQAKYTTHYKTYGPFSPALKNGQYTISLNNAKAYINKLASNGGVTQIRLRFKLDDNNNGVANFLKLYSGNAALAIRPKLIIEYYVP